MPQCKTLLSYISDTGNFLNSKDGLDEASIEKVLSLRQDSRWWIADALFWRGHLLLWLLGELHVEEPFVDLDAGEARLLHSFLAHLAVPFAAQLEEKTAQVLDLLF